MPDDDNQLISPVQEHGLESITSEGCRYFNAFAYPMAQSVPHIYLSSLPFSPAESAVLQHMHHTFQNNLAVEVGRLKQWPVIRQTLTGHTGYVYSAAFSSNGTRIVSGSSDKTVRIWDAVSGAPIGEPLQGHSHWVQSVAFSPDGTRIVSGSSDKTVRIWDAVSGVPLSKRTPEHSVTAPPNSASILLPPHETIQTSPNWAAAVSTVQGVIFSDGSILHDDGWVTTTDGLLLFWVPLEHRLGLLWPRTLTVIGAQPTRLNMHRFAHGPRWTQCRTGVAEFVM